MRTFPALKGMGVGVGPVGRPKKRARMRVPLPEKAPAIAVIPGSVVNFTLFLQKWPKIQHSSPGCLHQSLDFHKRSFSPPVVLGYKFADKCAAESAQVELGSPAIASLE